MKIEDIKKELSNYYMKELLHFEETFPCENPIHEIEIKDKDYCDEIDRVLKKMDGCDEETKMNAVSGYNPFDTIFIGYESEEDLWKRWTKYLRLRIFL